MNVRSPSVGELAHNLRVARKGDRRNSGEGQLKAHDCVQDVVHARQVLDAAEEGQTESGHYGDGPREEDALPPRPLQVQEALHRELTSVGTWTQRQRGGFQKS